MSNKGLDSVFLVKFKKEEILGTFLSAEKSEEGLGSSNGRDLIVQNMKSLM